MLPVMYIYGQLIRIYVWRITKVNISSFYCEIRIKRGSNGVTGNWDLVMHASFQIILPCFQLSLPEVTTMLKGEMNIMSIYPITHYDG